MTGNAGLYAELALAALRSKRTGRPFLLNLHLTWACDSRCSHCSIWKVRPEKEMSETDYLEVFSRIGASVAILNCTGGQPTLKPGFGRILRGAILRVDSLRLVQFSTNGLSPGADLDAVKTALRDRPDFPLRVSISLDGIGKRHDDIRGVSGNFARVSELFESLRALRREFPGLRAGFSTTLGAYNAGQAEELARAFPEKDFHTFDYYHASEDYYRDGGRADWVLERGEKRELAGRLRRITKGAEGFLNGLFLKIASGERPPACAAGRASATLMPDGSIKRCYFLPETLGNVRSGGDPAPASAALAECRACWNTCNAYATLASRPLSAAVTSVTSACHGLKFLI